MNIIKLDDFIAEAEKRFGTDRTKRKFICPRCKTPQSAEDLVAVGIKKENVNDYLAFSCLGRWTKDKGCDWTLGGLFKIHTLEIETPDGKRHPHFELSHIERKEDDDDGRKEDERDIEVFLG